MKKDIIITICFFLIMPISLSWAQDTLDSNHNNSNNTSIYNMENIVVTSTRTKHSIFETPTNISVITGEELENMDAKTVADAIKKLPGVYYSNANGMEPHISLRGTRIGMSGGALVLVDGIPVNLGKFAYTDFNSIPVENIEKIEVIKGPMSALYGGDSARGVINIITKHGKTPLNGKLSAIFGSYNDRRYSALLFGSKDKWDYNIQLKKLRRDGYRDHTSLDNYYAQGDIGFWPSDSTRIGLYLQVGDVDRELAKRLTKAEEKQDRKMVLDYSDADWTDIISGLNLKTEQSLFDIQSTIYYKNRNKNYENYLMATLGTPYKEDLDEDVYGIRSIFTFKHPIINKKNKLSFGFDYDHDKIFLKTLKAASKTIGAPYIKEDPKKTGDFTRQELGIFLQDELSILKNLTLVAGIRYDYFKFDNNAEYDFSQNGKYDYDETPTYDKFNPRISVNYRPLNNLSIYASYSKAYRAPNIYDYYASGSYSAKNSYTLKPETFTQYETGIRYAFSKWLNIDSSIFLIQIKDMLDLAYDQNGKYMGKQNISEVNIKGTEISLFGSPTTWFTYRINYTYTDARYADNILAKISKKQIIDIKDNRLTKIPYNKIVVDLDTTLYKKNKTKILWHIDMMSQDKYPLDKTNTDTYPGYTLVNTKLSLYYKKLEGFIAIDNIFDIEYDAYAYRSYGVNYYYPAPGTTIAIGISYQF